MADSFYVRKAVDSDAEAIAKIVRESMAYYKTESGIKGDVLESLTESIESVRERIRTQHCLCVFEHHEAEITASDGIETEYELLGTITVNEIKNPLKYSFSKKTYFKSRAVSSL